MSGEILYWLSFADPEEPEGKQFKGAIIAPCADFLEAVTWTHIKGINPGGEVMGAAFPRAPEISDDMIGTLLSRDYIENNMGGSKEWLDEEEYLDTESIRELLRREIESAGSMTKWAKLHNIHYPLVSVVLAGKRKPTRQILEALGLEAVEVYRPMQNG